MTSFELPKSSELFFGIHVHIRDFFSAFVDLSLFPCW
jgi:hypothetical protein